MQGKTRQSKTRHVKAQQGKARQGGNARQDKGRQDQERKDSSRVVLKFASICPQVTLDLSSSFPREPSEAKQIKARKCKTRQGKAKPGKEQKKDTHANLRQLMPKLIDNIGLGIVGNPNES